MDPQSQRDREANHEDRPERQITTRSPISLEIARKCGTRGFESMFNERCWCRSTAERPITSGGPAIRFASTTRVSEPFIALAMAAAVTSNIKSGTCVSLLAEHEPIALAKAIATLDFLAGGRSVQIRAAEFCTMKQRKCMGVDFPRLFRMVVGYSPMKELWTRPRPRSWADASHFPPVKRNPEPASDPSSVGISRQQHSGPCDRALRNPVAVADSWVPTLIAPNDWPRSLSDAKADVQGGGPDFAAFEISIAWGSVHEGGRPDTLGSTARLEFIASPDLGRPGVGWGPGHHRQGPELF